MGAAGPSEKRTRRIQNLVGMGQFALICCWAGHRKVDYSTSDPVTGMHRGLLVIYTRRSHVNSLTT